MYHLSRKLITQQKFYWQEKTRQVCTVFIDAKTTCKPIFFRFLTRSENYSNKYEGTLNYGHKYNSESRVLSAQRSQFIALLERFKDVEVFIKNPLTNIVKVEYNKLYYYESSERWILGEGLESDTMR